MNTKVAIMSEDKLDLNAISEAAEVIKKGGIVAFPTETVYGLGANALDQAAVKKIFEAKGRPQDNPLIVHVASKDISHLVLEIPSIAKEAMDRFWPGPLTIILHKSPLIPYATSAGLDTVGLRMPSNPIARRLIEESSVPIAAPSANISGKPSPTEVSRCIEDLSGRVDFIIGGEKSNVGVESTILDCTVEPPCILRPGGITLEMLKDICKDIYIDPSIMGKSQGDFKPKAPGMKYRHYAPKAPVKIIEGDLQKTIAKINEIRQNYIDDKRVVGIMATEETKDLYSQAQVLSLGSRDNLEEIAKNIFEALREMDDRGVDVILCESFKEEGIGLAIMNRLRKSSGFDIIKI